MKHWITEDDLASDEVIKADKVNEWISKIGERS